MKHIKLFNEHSDYETYMNGSDKVLPNVSYCENENEVHYNPYIESVVTVTFNVTSTSEPTQIAANGQKFGAFGMIEINILNNFAKIDIDGVKQPTINETYTFDTLGEHTVKYTLVNPTSIENGCFLECRNIKSVIIPDGVTSIGNVAFYYCTGLTSITIPDSATSIGNQAFYYCTGLTSITIPDSVTTIGTSAFQQCSGLTSVTISNSVTSIGYQTFQYCTSLTNITIPDSVTSIGGNVFNGCSGLTSITSLATTAPTIQSTTFYNVKSGGTLYVPSGSSGYNTWMSTSDSYLGKYSWTKVEQ